MSTTFNTKCSPRLGAVAPASATRAHTPQRHAVASALPLVPCLANAHVTHAATLAQARKLLESDVFSLVVLDPVLPDGDARTLLPLLTGTPLLVYSANQPEWRGAAPAFLPKPWTSARQLWSAISGLLGVPATLTAGD